mmetsp:Transcript_9151/g.17230  ORF Transcript_9151/g.17230 Transcript_9151/m.17230 type:complete len:95 (+) Transcript_9151:165-449(+)
MKHMRIVSRQVKANTFCKQKSSSNSNINFSYPARTLSRRTIMNDSRLSSSFQTMKCALSVEASSLRYAGYALGNSAEESMIRGWDNLDQEDDGT